LKLIWELAAESRNEGNTLRIKRVLLSDANGTAERRVKGELFRLLPKDLQETAAPLIEAIRNVIYISAIRLGTAEVFPAPESASPVHADVGMQGEYAPWWFERFLDEEVDPKRRHPNEPASTLRRQFNAWANELFPGAQGNAQRLSKTNLLRLELRIGDTDDWQRPSNIGYGLTYAFPVLVAGLLAKPGQLLIIDSPEAHLHPLGQSRMGRFLGQIASTGVQVLVETHSDHVLNGIRLAARDGVIEPQDVAIHFFNHARADKGARIVCLLYTSPSPRDRQKSRMPSSA
jgi:predicted ATPase